jgi:hypothetical protein
MAEASEGSNVGGVPAQSGLQAVSSAATSPGACAQEAAEHPASCVGVLGVWQLLLDLALRGLAEQVGVT